MMNRMMATCRAAGMSASDISSRFRIPAGIVSRWERGELKPPAWVERMVFDFLADERKKQYRKGRRQSGSGRGAAPSGWKR